MSWEDAATLCFEQVPLVAKRLPLNYWQNTTDWQQRVRLLFADEKRLKPKIDEIMRRFSALRTLPELPAGILNFLVCARLMCACDTVNILLAAEATHRLVPDPIGKADEVILGWLLIEIWNEWRWDSFLKLEALRSLGGDNSFYNPPALPPHFN